MKDIYCANEYLMMYHCMLHNGLVSWLPGFHVYVLIGRVTCASLVLDMEQGCLASSDASMWSTLQQSAWLDRLAARAKMLNLYGVFSRSAVQVVS